MRGSPYPWLLFETGFSSAQSPRSPFNYPCMTSAAAVTAGATSASGARSAPGKNRDLGLPQRRNPAENQAKSRLKSHLKSQRNGNWHLHVRGRGRGPFAYPWSLFQAGLFSRFSCPSLCLSVVTFLRPTRTSTSPPPPCTFSTCVRPSWPPNKPYCTKHRAILISQTCPNSKTRNL